MTDSNSFVPHPPEGGGLPDHPVVRRALSLEHGIPIPPDPIAARGRLMARLAVTELVSNTQEFSLPWGHTRRWTHTRKRRFAQVAIGGVFGVILVVLGWHTGVSYATGRFSSGVSTYSTDAGQRATITLPDGSRVLLNVGSRLEVPTDFVAGNRVVKLTGEAIFAVQPRTGTPFSVVAGQTQTRVLGTNFLVRRYRGDSTAVVAVRDGKVAVGSSILTANQQIVIDEHGLSSIAEIDTERFLFATGVLAFRETPLPEAIADLNRWYNVDIRLGDSSLVSRRLTGDCTSGTLASLVELLELTFDLQVVRDGRILTLYPRG